MPRLLCALAVVCASALVATVQSSSPCKLRLDGKSFDFSSLSRSVGQYGTTYTSDDGDAYYIGVCSSITGPDTSHGCPLSGSCIAYVVEANTGYCRCLGQTSSHFSAAGDSSQGDGYDVQLRFTKGTAEGDDYRSVVYDYSCASSNGDLTVDVDEDTLQYTVTWAVKAACGSNKGGSSGAVSTSQGVLFVLGVGFALYCVGGAAYNYRVHEERGTDVIPHRDFWFDLPGLVKDGFVLTYTTILAFVLHAMGRSEVPSKNKATRMADEEDNDADSHVEPVHNSDQHQNEGQYQEGVGGDEHQAQAQGEGEERGASEHVRRLVNPFMS